jgi:hypothetical protein
MTIPVRGVLSVPRENLIEMARVANRLGWQMTAHDRRRRDRHS